MPGTILRPDSMLRGLQWEITSEMGGGKVDEKNVHRLTLFWHDAGGPVLTLYARDHGAFNVETFRDIIFDSNQFGNPYAEGDSAPHVQLHSLRDVSESVVENSVNADPHVHIQVNNEDSANGDKVEDTELEQRLENTISAKLTSLGMIGVVEAKQCCDYFKKESWGHWGGSDSDEEGSF